MEVLELLIFTTSYFAPRGSINVQQKGHLYNMEPEGGKNRVFSVI